MSLLKNEKGQIRLPGAARKVAAEGQHKLPKDNKLWINIGRGFIYFLLTVIVIRGVIGSLSNDAVLMEKTAARLDDFMSHPNAYLENNGISAFTEDFMRDYLTYDRQARLSELTDNRYKGDGKLDITYPDDVVMRKVVGVRTAEVNKISDERFNLTLIARCSVTKRQTVTENGVTSTKDIETLDRSYYKIGVFKDQSGRYAILTAPARIPDQSTAVEARLKDLSPLSASEGVAMRAKMDLQSFYKSFFEGSANDVSYVTDGKIQGFEGKMKFVSLEESAFRDTGKELLVRSKIKATDEYGITVSLSYELIMIMKDDKWVVRSIDPVNEEFKKYEVTPKGE